ncbi:hypothetical protein GALMADRAFT_255549 [Galerina marginata CBS 339.88]|uniref:NACHT domain-containing protein n=1 Tax=Galerina marginata (strain CBS 339.88) TaxID=685588 RepID=A0A067SFT7_GALM3|nr:hypothetical protein GALMADRAFT_255549 [Galerina marginata CBS 339.88]
MFSVNAPTTVTGGTFIMNVPELTGSMKGFDRLVEASAPAAFHNSKQRFDPPKCHPNTRVAVLRRITEWVQGTNTDAEDRQASMLWLYGAAGSGKTAIAQSLAEQFDDDDGSLFASFFFSRTDPTRNHAGHLVATIAYQIALKLPQVKDLIVAVVEDDPLIFSKSLEMQFSRLIFEPLEFAAVSNRPALPSACLIILDGLDECGDEGERCSILRIIMATRREGPLPTFLRFLVASRPEIDIKTIINSQSKDTNPDRVSLDKDYRSYSDIRLFLQDKFRGLKDYHPHRAFIPSEWPSKSTINKLVETSSGQFIYASTVVKYVSSNAHKPNKRLEIILSLRSTLSDAPFSALDELYTHILSTADDPNLVLRVLGLALLSRFYYYYQVEEILGLEKGDVEVLFSPLGSIVSLEGSFFKILHASLADYLFDKSRSKGFYIHPAEKHTENAHLIFQRLGQPISAFDFQKYFDELLRTLKIALPTAELQEDIVQFSLDQPEDDLVFDYKLAPQAYTEDDDHIRTPPEKDRFFFIVVEPFLLVVKALAWDDAAKLYEIKLEQFERVLKRRFGGIPDLYSRLFEGYSSRFPYSFISRRVSKMIAKVGLGQRS